MHRKKPSEEKDNAHLYCASAVPSYRPIPKSCFPSSHTAPKFNGSQRSMKTKPKKSCLQKKPSPGYQKKKPLKCKERFGGDDKIHLLSLLTLCLFVVLWMGLKRKPWLAWKLRNGKPNIVTQSFAHPYIENKKVANRWEGEGYNADPFYIGRVGEGQWKEGRRKSDCGYVGIGTTGRAWTFDGDGVGRQKIAKWVHGKHLSCPGPKTNAADVNTSFWMLMESENGSSSKLWFDDLWKKIWYTGAWNLMTRKYINIPDFLGKTEFTPSTWCGIITHLTKTFVHILIVGFIFCISFGVWRIWGFIYNIFIFRDSKNKYKSLD